MTSIKTQNNSLEKLCHTVIEQKLGDLSELPPELVDCVMDVYREFMNGYLNMVRQKKRKPVDWIPATVSIDSELTEQMRHFFSDYQHVTGKFYRLNLEVRRLQALDRDTQQKLYQHALDAILKRCVPQVDRGKTYG